MSPRVASGPSEPRPSVRVSCRLPPDERAPGAARHVVAGIHPYLAPQVWEALELLISELVTNSVLHADLGPDDWVGVEVISDGTRVRVVVRDPGPGIDPDREVREPRREGLGGWGLVLVDRLASRWGALAGDEPAVWFELDVAPSGEVVEHPPRRGASAP